MRFVKPLDTKALEWAARDHDLVVTMEENVLAGGFGEHAADYYEENFDRHIRILQVGIDDRFIPHGNADQLKSIFGLDAETTAQRILKALE